jgi:hypothetical protein
MEMVLASFLLITACCTVKVEMLLAEAKYPNLPIVLIEQTPHKIPFKLLGEEKLVLGNFLQKSDDKITLLTSTNYSMVEHYNIVNFITLIRMTSYG